ncbi:MAG TPA: ribonuclease H family protein [Anaerolineales bacterium]|nr:ribonuclease H family protein [Anaerolineales bacterium]
MYNFRMPAQRFYVVWKGRRRGIFDSWAECEAQVNGYAGAEYKAFGTRREAERALGEECAEHRGKDSSSQRWLFAVEKPVLPSISVDAACSGSPGRLEFRGVETETGKPVFADGPFDHGTNNVGEFLAIVEAMKWLDERQHPWPIYSDSANAIGWVKAKKCNTQLKRLPSNRKLFERIAEAEKWLRFLTKRKVLKWDTKAWGEIPADYGRK